MRERPRLLLIIALAIVLGFASAASGFVIPAVAQNEGTVKIHDGAATTADIASPDAANQTKVCSFHLHGIAFSAGEQIEWWIDQQPPTGTANAIASTTATSDQNGNWYTSVLSLADGHYKLYWRAVTPQGLTPKHKVFQVQCGTPTMGTISVTKYNDLNGDGHQQGNEPGLQGWVFNVTTGPTSGSITTDADGLGLLDVAAGTYTVTEVAKTGWSNTEPDSGAYIGVTVAVGQTTDLVFGNHQNGESTPTPTPTPTPTATATPTVPQTPAPQSGTLRITKYNDLARNGVQDSVDTLIAGVTFQIKSNGTTILAIMTGANGLATATLVPGTYSVVENVPTGWMSTDPGGATPTKTVTITDGNSTSVSFGNAQGGVLPPTTQTQLTVLKYADANANGVRDAGEGVLAGFTFTVRSSDGAIAQTITTDASGIAAIANLPLATYTVTESARDGWTNTDPGGNASKTFTFTATTTSVALSFGNAQIRLPSTATDDNTTGLTLTLVLIGGIALMFFMARRAARPS